ncbi:putative uncharacterized protein DDB_G0286901 [Microplitis demolitor]|uniref:putative uncharacterized protein DDB_G0286901 n=1 Tax=Microplitis demolitor TaxID=69319 RepID=UPI0004400359|nr:putative uncharacterized protein DDB_G0286901 [Microplitis demolitor]XP_008546254.1 putative uncharacterized protein DDB_G0286901 [Microplitis demolitor]XP_008546255.1 putative uncharacterized protein DDB_G0286901 [Microplitis demolitor]
MGQGTECADRPAEVSVIRFVSRNRTIEEIAPKKEIYTCKQQGCGKIFTNQDEYKTHEALEELKIRFICREPGCGKEMSDPGTMWRHYQEYHSNETTNIFICPYTSCGGSIHTSNDNLEQHIESSHRHPLALIPTEPEIICFEGPASTTSSTTTGNLDDEENNPNDNSKDDEFEMDKKNIINKSNDGMRKNINYNSNYSPKDNDRLIIQENTDANQYDARNICNNSAKLYITDDSIFKNNDYDNKDSEVKLQEHRIDLGNLEKVFRSGFEGNRTKIESSIDSSCLNTTATTTTATPAAGNSDDDEEYTPKKQRMSRCKQELPYKCDVNGCGKMYKYISHYRHHQDSHKVQEQTNKEANKLVKTNKIKQQHQQQQQGKASTVSFFLCKIPGCGAQVNNVTSLWKHYQDNHANNTKPVVQSQIKSNQLFRCKILNCDMEFRTSVQLYKHLSDVHSVNTNPRTGNVIGTLLSDSNNSGSNNTNGKTDEDCSLRFIDNNDLQQNDNNITMNDKNLKTDFKANCNVININNYDNNDNEERKSSSLISMAIKEESRD